MKQVRRVPYGGEGVVQVVQSPSNDHDVVNVQPEGEHGCSQTNSCTHTGQILTLSERC